MNKYQIEKGTRFDKNLLPLIQNLSAEGRTEADIGMVLGYAGKDPAQWLKDLKRNHPEVKDAWEAGRQLADLKLVQTAFEVATGYGFTETEESFRQIEKMVDGELKIVEIPVGSKIRKKYTKPDATLLFKLLCNRLPEYFQDVKRFQIDRRTVDLKGDISKQIEEAAGKLMSIVDAEWEPDENIEIQGDKNESLRSD